MSYSMIHDRVVKKSIPGYEDLYYITSDGEVWHKKKNRKLSYTAGCVSLRKDGKNKGYNIDKLVYTLFVDSDYDGVHKIYHVDNNPDNYAASNLSCKSRIANLSDEIWKPFNLKYEVSSMGRVRYVVTDSLCTVKSFNENSMAVVNIDSKTFRIDELVARVFLNMKDGQCVYHRDGDIHNYALSNLSLDPCIPTEDGECWVDVKGYEGRYKVSSHGRIYSVPRKERRKSTNYVTVGGKFLKPGEDKDGYYRVVLVNTTDTKDMFVHKLVALNFIENPCPSYYDCVNHKDGDKHNNHVENLEWCTTMQNIRHAIDTGLRDDAVLHNPRSIPTIVVGPDRVKRRFESIQQAAVYLGVDSELLRLYLHGKRRWCIGLDTSQYNVYMTTKDDFENVIVNPL